MVQILEADERPSFGQRVSQGIGQGLSFMDRLNQQKQQQDAMAKQTGKDLSGLPPEIQKMIVENQLKGDLIEKEYGFKKELEGSKIDPKQQKEAQTKESAQKAFNRMVELIPKLGAGSTSIFAGSPETRSNVGEFTALKASLEGLLVEMTNRGTLTQSQSNRIYDKLLPLPNDTQATIEGKLQGIATVLGLDASALNPKGYSEKSGILPKDEGSTNQKPKNSKPIKSYKF